VKGFRRIDRFRLIRYGMDLSWIELEGMVGGRGEILRIDWVVGEYEGRIEGGGR
jgi:hypothetical protein